MLRFHCRNWSCKNNEADAKSFFRVEIFFLQTDVHPTHCWKMDVVVINRSLTSFVRKSWRASLIFKTWDASRVFAASLLLKLALKFFVRIGFFVTDSTSRVIIPRSLLKVDECESGELFEELFWNDVAYFFPMNVNILLLGFFLKGVEMEMTFSLFKNCLAEIKSSFVLNVAFPGQRKHCWRWISRIFFWSWSLVHWIDRSLSIFEDENVTSNRCRALQS